MHDLYGFIDGDLDAARAAIEQALGIRMRAAVNAYRGRFYSYEGGDGASLILQLNWDPLDGECMEDQFPEMRVLLYVSGASGIGGEPRLAHVPAARLLVRQRAL